MIYEPKFLISVFALVLIVLVGPMYAEPERILLGEISADINGDGIKEKIAKYEINKNGTSKIMLQVLRNDLILKELILPYSKDAKLSFKERRGNLFVADINGDGIKDVLTISRNENAESKLSVLTFKNGDFTTDI